MHMRNATEILRNLGGLKSRRHEDNFQAASAAADVPQDDEKKLGEAVTLMRLMKVTQRRRSSEGERKEAESFQQLIWMCCVYV